jgi:hypothetical protein
MKWLKNRNVFINEAKLRDVIFPSQAKVVAKMWGSKYLDYEEVTPTKKIQQGKWKLSEDDKYLVLNAFTDSNVKRIFEILGELPDAFAEFILQTIAPGNEPINIQSPTLTEIGAIYNKIFLKISVADTIADTVISKDERGVPIKDEEGNMIKTEKVPGELVISNNKVNINSVISDYNSLVRKYVAANIGDKYKASDEVEENTFYDEDIQNFVSMTKSSEEDYDIDYNAFDKDMYLSIQHNPKDILNMSISRFYSSCQNLYTGDYRNQVLGNVFDPNSIPAFIIFETPIYLDETKISDQLPLCRMMIRNIESVEEDSSDSATKLYFDRSYPDRMREWNDEDVFKDIVEKYTENRTIDSYIGVDYLYTPDIDIHDNISEPYHDRFDDIVSKHYIGKNAKAILISQSFKWSDYRIAPDTKVTEIIIETTDVPDNLFELNLDLKLLKFRYLEVNSLEPFKRIKTSGVSFDNCKISSNVFVDMDRNVKAIRLTSIEMDLPDFKQFEELEELHLVYTLDSVEQLKEVTEGLNLKKLVISGDLVTNQSKEYLTNIVKSKGTKIEIVGPSIKNK